MAFKARKPPEFQLIPEENRANQWAKWKELFNIFASADSSTTIASEPTKVAIFLNIGGPLVIDIFNRIQSKITGTAENGSVALYDVLRAFDNYFDIYKSATETRHRFLTTVQAGRDIDTFTLELEKRAEQCQFCATCRDSIIKDVLIIGLDSETIRRELLKQPELTLARALETAKMMTQNTGFARQCRAAPLSGSSAGHEAPMELDALRKDRSARPAGIRKCYNCGGRGHFAKECPSKRVDAVDAEGAPTEDPDLDFIGELRLD